MKRDERASFAKANRARNDPKATPLPAEQHSGEGSASVLESMLKLESRRRLAGRPVDPPRIIEPPETT